MSIEDFIALVEAYKRATGLAEATISTRVLHDGKRIELIRGGRDVGARRLIEARDWFARNWPENAVWPRRVERPDRTAEAAE